MARKSSVAKKEHRYKLMWKASSPRPSVGLGRPLAGPYLSLFGHSGNTEAPAAPWGGS